MKRLDDIIKRVNAALPNLQNTFVGLLDIYDTRFLVSEITRLREENVLLYGRVDQLQAELAKHHDVPLIQKYADENSSLKRVNLELSGPHEDGDRCPACGTVCEGGVFKQTGLHMTKAQAVVDAAREVMKISNYGNLFSLQDALKSLDERGDG